MEKFLKLEPRFVTVDDFDNYHNANLRDMIRSNGGNDSYRAERFLARIELHLMAWIDNTTFRRLRYEELNDRQLMLFKCAILEQAFYILNNGDLSLESGYNPEQGVVTDLSTLNSLRVSQVAIDLLSNAGLFNLNVKNKARSYTGGFFNGDY